MESREARIKFAKRGRGGWRQESRSGLAGVCSGYIRRAVDT
jgi:hypothetical protein